MKHAHLSIFTALLLAPLAKPIDFQPLENHTGRIPMIGSDE